ncbi:uncharacterized protein BX663DRAFT_565862, partial [Cokeromyces recurvatus]|uniref:uncharacterized protein n=1 Tax=Cokeromyces recurvatus TaxID=90255 RepID=UPI00221EE5DB
MLLQARSLWYRILSRKIPHSDYLYQIQTISTNLCRLCQSVPDSLDHFLFLCPIRHKIWMNWKKKKTNRSNRP